MTENTYPTVTEESIDEIIVNAQYFHFEGTTVTVCLLELKNGFRVLGESACACPEIFDVTKGKDYALEDAKNRIWKLEGYLLKQRLFEQQ